MSSQAAVPTSQRLPEQQGPVSNPSGPAPVFKNALYESEPVFPPDAPPRLHQSLAAILMNRSPLHAWWRAFGKSDEPEEYDARTTLGQIAHSLLLGGKRIVSVDFPDWRKAEAREQREQIIGAGGLPILKAKLDEAVGIVERVQHELQRRGFMDPRAKKEVTAVWTNSFGVQCEGRLDWVNGLGAKRPKEFLILDFKFGESAQKRKCENKFIEYGYDIQWAAYMEAIHTIYPKLQGRGKMLFIFVEMEPPYAIRVMPLGGTMRSAGEWRWLRACELWKRYMGEFGIETPWPSYEDDGEPAECPPWAHPSNTADAVFEHDMSRDEARP